jgi:hypothetical protein
VVEAKGNDPMMLARQIICLAFAATILSNSPAAAKSSWSWISLNSQGAKWAISQGEAIVGIDDTNVAISLEGPADEVECKMTGRIDRKSRLSGSKVRTRSVRVKVVCYGTETDASWYEGTMSILPLGKSGVRQVIRIDDGFNIIALTSEN